MLGKEHAEHTLQCPDFVSTGLQNHEESYFACSFEMKRFMYRPTMETHNFPKTTAGQKTKIKAVNMAYFELLQFIES